MYPTISKPALFTLFALLTATSTTQSITQSITLDLYHSNTTCLAGQSGDITYNAITIESGCQRVSLYPNGQYTAPGAFSAKVSSTNPRIVLHLFDDTACTDTMPDTVEGDGSTGCALQALSGAGWMSFKVETA